MKLRLKFGKTIATIELIRAKAAGLPAWPIDDLAERALPSSVNKSNALEASVWVYACVNAIAEQVAQIPVRFSRLTPPPIGERTVWRKQAGETPVESGPLVQLFERPHAHLSGAQFWHLVVSWLMLRGEFFVVPLARDFRVLSRQLPDYLLPVDPDGFQEVVADNVLLGWRYKEAGPKAPVPPLELLPDEVINDRLPNPRNFWRGLSPLTAGLLAANTDHIAAVFTFGAINSKGALHYVLETEQALTEEQRRQIGAAFVQSLRHAGRANEPVVLSGGLKITTPSISGLDNLVLETRKVSRQEICAIFRVPQEVLGYTEDANRAVAEAQRLSWIENRILPICRRLEATFNAWLHTFMPDVWLWFDTDSLPIMQSALRQRFAAAKAAFDMGVPIDVVSAAFDLGLPPDLPHAGRTFLPFSLQEITPRQPAEEQERPELETEAVGKAGAARTKATAREQKESVLRMQLNLLRRRLRRFFWEQEQRVLAALSDQLAKNKPAELAKAIDGIFDKHGEDQRLKEAIQRILLAQFQDGAVELWREIGATGFDVAPVEALEWFKQREPAILGINTETWQRLRASLIEGLQTGESYNELADRVRVIFEDARGARALRIALTETNCALNSGRFFAMTEAGVQRKGWLTRHLETTRQSHLANERLTEMEGGIPIDQPWPNGVMYPGDPTGPPSEVINCGCTTYPILPTRP